ncbi:MAG TPA: MAPEG family protein [Stellaceae bacterium]|nr:MAPEG family protein [Stellaceae bacterium]
MTPDLRLLLWSVVLAFVQMLVATVAANAQVGPGTLAGNRDPEPVLTGLAGRAQRAHRNMLENLPLFIALVVIAQIAGKADATTLLGAQLFFWARLAYALIYVVGIPWLRTLVWAVSAIGMFLIFLQLI